MIRSPWSRGNFNPNQQRQNKATDFDLPHAKNSNFPQQCHHAGNIGLKTSSFLLLSTRVCPRVWIRSIEDAWMSCSKEIRRRRKKAILSLQSHENTNPWSVIVCLSAPLAGSWSCLCFKQVYDKEVMHCESGPSKHLARALSSPDEALKHYRSSSCFSLLPSFPPHASFVK